MQRHHALEPTQPLPLLSLESFRGKCDFCLNFLTNSLCGILKSLVTTMNGWKGNLDDWTHQREHKHLVEVRRVNPGSFQSLTRWASKQSSVAGSMRLSKGSTMDTQGCSSGYYFIGRRIRGGVGPIGYLGTNRLARKTQDSTPNAGQSAASGYSPNSYALPDVVFEFGTEHASSQHPRCAGLAALTRGAHSEAIPTDPCLVLSRNLQTFLDAISSESEAIPTHTALPLIRSLRVCLEAISFCSEALPAPPAILCGQNLETCRKAFKFRLLNILFHTADGQPWEAIALQDTGADQNAISDVVVKQLGFWDARKEFTEADKQWAPLALGGNPVYPLATIELTFSTLCGCDSGIQKFNIYEQHQLANHEVILDVTLVERLGHLQKVFCGGTCSLV